MSNGRLENETKKEIKMEKNVMTTEKEAREIAKDVCKKILEERKQI